LAQQGFQRFRKSLQGQTAESLVQLKAQIVISLSGIDETVTQAVHARHLYQAQELLWNYELGVNHLFGHSGRTACLLSKV
jgi:hypothetical protein